MTHPRHKGIPEHLQPAFTAQALVEVEYYTTECVVCGDGAEVGDTCSPCGPMVRFDPPLVSHRGLLSRAVERRCDELRREVDLIIDESLWR